MRLFFFADCFPDESAESGTYEWSDDEEPELLQSQAALEESRADATCRVDRCSCDWDAYDVDEDEGEADSEACEVACAFLSVGCAEYDEDEEESEYSLCEECL